MKVIGAWLFFCLLASCGMDDEKQISSDSRDVAKQDTATREMQPAMDVYGVKLNDSVVLALQQWDSTINLSSVLGPPTRNTTKKLDEHSDTFSGSFMRKMEWPGLKIQLFSPKGNGKTFWVQEIILTTPQFVTTKSIHVGNSFEKVQAAYPALQKFPGENENMYYIADNGYEKSIEMEFQDRKLKQLRMYYMMQ